MKIHQQKKRYGEIYIVLNLIKKIKEKFPLKLFLLFPEFFFSFCVYLHIAKFR